jgi:uncharacterized surface protein with fasciclin (FAS1) repeats
MFNLKSKKMKKSLIILCSLFVIGASITANAQKKTVVGIAASNNDFSTLVAAVKAAGLVDALSGEGPFTVFAPTNAAFGKIDEITLNSLLERKNRRTLANILKYHVVAKDIRANDVVSALKLGDGETRIEMLNGQTLKVIQKNGKIWLQDKNGNYSQIVKTDIVGKNGVIHVIDAVVMPKKKRYNSHH